MNKDFRKAYYGTLGVQTVEAKTSLDAAFSKDPIDIQALMRTCQAVRIPRMYRPLVWKAILGVVPPGKETWGFGEEGRFDQFEDLRRAAGVLFLSQSADDGFTADIMLKMLLIHECKDGVFRAMKYERIPHLFSIADCILEVCDGRDVDAYWIFRFFVVKMGVSLTSSISKRHYAQCTALGELLKVHNPEFLNHLIRIGVQLDVLAE
ncbi:UNVERIFIED_CONTAM: TBC1 domain member 7 [Siphonaria sp. JEL0065]|nr:TBC1 domain member 7 [Siphonaria sp. JEL0065]